MSNQQPLYNPFMFPFPSHYPPPLFMNPMMPPQPRNQPNIQNGEGNPNQKPFPMHPFGYPPFPMMYRPPPHPYYPFFDPKVGPRDFQFPLPISFNKELFHINHQNKKIKIGENSQADKKQSSVIILSDDEQQLQDKRKNGFAQKQSIERHLNKQKVLSFQPQAKRIVRKFIPHLKQDPPAAKVRVQQKKKNLGLQQKKIKLYKLEDKDLKIVAEKTKEIHNQSYSRSSRSKFLTAKDGKGKIMIGEDFQANLPIFLPRNEILTIWVDQKKSCLLSRFIK